MLDRCAAMREATQLLCTVYILGGSGGVYKDTIQVVNQTFWVTFFKG